MFNLFPRLSPKDENDKEYRQSQTITFNQLVELIKAKNPIVDLARQYGKPSDQYDTIKTTQIPAIFANGYNENNSRSTKSYFRSTGYIYLDFDFNCPETAAKYKSELTSKAFISAAWVSLSGKGVSALVKINPKECNKYQYLKYWDKLNELFGGKLDTQTRDFYRPLCLSHDDSIYVNANAVPFNTLVKIDYTDGLKYRTPIPLEKFENVNKPVVYPEGLEVLNLDFYKYRINKVKVGYRTSTIGAISIQLIYLNPAATKKQLLNGLMSFNRNYTVSPLSEKEVFNILSSNLKKEVLDVSKYLKRKYVFFHPDCKMPKPLKDKIRYEEMRKLKTVLIADAIDIHINQIKPDKITVNGLSNFLNMSKATIYRYLNSNLKSKIDNYNSKSNVPFSQPHIYSPMGYNMRGRETNVPFLIYEAIEALQDGINKITQQRIADHISVNVKTVKRNWLIEFKEVVKAYNQSVKPIDEYYDLPV